MAPRTTRRTLTSFAAAGLLLAAPAWAQADEQEDSPAGMEGSATVETPPKTSEPAPKEAPNAAHTVERGDTLWDLSRKYLGSPWYWPKVWSYNPEIANPHWIYPGNNVRFYGAEDQPSQVEVGTEVPDIEQGAMVEDDERVSVSGQLSFRPKNAYRAALPGFVTVKELEESPRVVGSFSEETNLTTTRTVYVDVSVKKTLKVGDQTVFFRELGEVVHPATQAFFGYLTQVVGEGRVLAVDSKKNIATVLITQAFYEVLRGDSVSPAGESVVRNVSPRPNERSVKGGTLIKAIDGVNTPAESFFVIIDRGADEGVKVGNFFTILRSGDMGDPTRFYLNTNDPALPREPVGRCIVMDVKSKSNICLITSSLRELRVGDEADLEAGAARTASR